MSGHDETGDWAALHDFGSDIDIAELVKTATMTRTTSPTPSSDALPSTKCLNSHIRRKGCTPRNGSPSKHRKRRRSSTTTHESSHNKATVPSLDNPNPTSSPEVPSPSRNPQLQHFEADVAVDTDSDVSLPELSSYRPARSLRRSHVPHLARRQGSVKAGGLEDLDVDNIGPTRTPLGRATPSPTSADFLSARSRETLAQGMSAIRHHRSVHAPLTPTVIEVDDDGNDSNTSQVEGPQQSPLLPMTPTSPTTTLPPPAIHAGSKTALEVDPTFSVPAQSTHDLATFMWRRANGGIRETTVVRKESAMETTTTKLGSDLAHNRPRMRKRVRGRKISAPAPVRD